MKKIMISILLIAILASGTAFAAEDAVPALYGDKPMLISAPSDSEHHPILISAQELDNVLGYDLLQMADTMEGMGRIIAFETSEDGYIFTIKDRVTKKDLTLTTDENTRINTKMFYDMQLGGIVEVFYTTDRAIAINVLDKESQEGTVYVDGTIEALNESTVTIDGKVIDLTMVTMSQCLNRWQPSPVGLSRLRRRFRISTESRACRRVHRPSRRNHQGNWQ
jgi:hypothetical protein